MYSCKNCGGNLRFDISSQRLKCPYCSSDFDCYEIEEETAPFQQAPAEITDSVEVPESDSQTYEVTVFSCPMCGGEIISRDQSVSEFCTYCGQSVVLEKKMRKEKRPKKIIPFQITEENCKDIYRKKLKGTFFAPKDLKDPRFLEKFRGIYIPYWSYSFYHKGPVKLTGTREHRSGDYDIKEFFDIEGEVDASYEGIVYDASSSFSDDLSEAIAPYDPKGLKEFVPSYLSGFYGDVSDVPASLYKDDANRIANDKTISTIVHAKDVSKYDVETGTSVESLNKKLNTVKGTPEGAMLPVWFLTWRNRDRVAYMTVNGQTGRIAADIPVDLKKYVIASLLFAVPLYFLMNSFMFFLPSTALFLSGLFAIFTSILYYEEMHSIASRDKREMDRGYQYVIQKKRNAEKRKEAKNQQALREGKSRWQIENEQRKAAKAQGQIYTKGKKKKPFAYVVLHGMTVFFSAITILYVIYKSLSDSIFGAIFSRITLNLFLICLVFLAWEYLVMDVDENNDTDRKIARGILGSQLSVIIAAMINLVHPVSDLIYYFGMIVCYIGIFTTLIRILRQYNHLVTRPIPEFHNRGGE